MAIRGCLLKLASAITGANYDAGTAVIPWDTEVYDTHGFHTGSSSKIIIPASMNGLRGIFTSFIEVSNASASPLNIRTQILKGGSLVYDGAAASTRLASGGNGQSASQHWHQISTAPVLLTTGDEWEVIPYVNGDNSVDISANSSFGLYVYGASTGTIRCLATISAAQIGTNPSAPLAVSFDADVYDTHSIHDPSGTPTKLIVPSAADGKYGVLAVSLECTGFEGTSLGHSVAIRKNGSVTYSGFGANSGQNAFTGFLFLFAQTQVHRFTAGDEYEVIFWTSGDSAVTIQKVHAGTGTPNVTHFGMWVYG